MRRRELLTRAAALVLVAGCNAISGIDEFRFGATFSEGGSGSTGTGGTSTGGGVLPGCGDGQLDAGEACDDGNDASGDGCDGDCAIEDGFACGGAPSACTAYLSLVATQGPGLAHALPDDQQYDGSLGTMECQTLTIPDEGAAEVVEVEVKVGLSHTWISDLVIKVASPEGTVVTLLSRAGIEEAADTSSELDGDGSDLAISHPIVFRDDATSPAELMGVNIGNDKVVCRDDGICAHRPSPGKGPGERLADFEGEPPAGDWKVCVADADNTLTGTVDLTQITVRAQ
ncbi:proprotein convertase P-domain-containing protein [Chondromyces apiculatus]|uniref:Putative lipoprotein n=1 Tax=Chondromyces apiculatus DSM 436 TaxID=1192034 RepID=A0A017SU21_9BACT|nr:proprotein convertase P-domain-containing protein [Chondromyces apiculatus]EYF00483.1 putative lipoprotein [Chondromyces apiculatus DSM 436]